MAESQVISALVKKRSELAGEIEYCKKLLDKAKSDLVSIDKTIHIFDDSIDLRIIKSKRVVKKSYFSSGEATKMVLDVLRTADEPLKTDEISDIILQKKSDLSTLSVKSILAHHPHHQNYRLYLT